MCRHLSDGGRLLNTLLHIPSPGKQSRAAKGPVSSSCLLSVCTFALSETENAAIRNGQRVGFPCPLEKNAKEKTACACIIHCVAFYTGRSTKSIQDSETQTRSAADLLEFLCSCETRLCSKK